MRVTIDIDSKSKKCLYWCVFRGLLYFRKMPDIRKTMRGFHVIWRGLKINEKESYEYRKRLGDDWKRIELDKASPKRLKQVLFTEKVVTYNGYCPPKMFNTKGNRKNCPLCGKPIQKAIISWTIDNKYNAIIKKDNTECEKHI